MSLDTDSQPQFGEMLAGVTYVDRPGAYALVTRDGLLLVVETLSGYFLPGGGIGPDESSDDALRRELREEAGLSVEEAVDVGVARQYVVDSETGIGYNKIEHFVLVAIGSDVFVPIEDDHLARWVTIEAALHGLTEAAQAWAVRTLLPRT